MPWVGSPKELQVGRELASDPALHIGGLDMPKRPPDWRGCDNITANATLGWGRAYMGSPIHLIMTAERSLALARGPLYRWSLYLESPEGPSIIPDEEARARHPRRGQSKS